MMISIIIPCYNHGRYLEEALGSVAESVGEAAVEVIIVDDGSTDPFTKQLLPQLAARGYRVITQANQGLAAARNNGIAVSSGKYFIPLDSDNKLAGPYLTTAVQLLENDPTIDAVYGNPVFFGDERDARGTGLRRVGAFDLNKILDCNYIDACGIIRKSAWEKVGGYDGRMPLMGNEDWELWIALALAGGKIHYLDEVCFHYRVAADSMSATDYYASEKHTRNRAYIYEKHSSQLVSSLLRDLQKHETVAQYIKHNRLKSIAKLVLGYKL